MRPLPNHHQGRILRRARGLTARKESFRYCPETCPAVDGHFDYLIDDLVTLLGFKYAEEITELVVECRGKVKADGTLPLRDALIEALEELIEMKQ